MERMNPIHTKTSQKKPNKHIKRTKNSQQKVHVTHEKKRMRMENRSVKFS